jgi:hypothetical protein
MFSLAGIPPLAGFFAKWYVFLGRDRRRAVRRAGAVIGVLASVGRRLLLPAHRQGDVFRRAARLAQWRRHGFETVRAEWLAKAGPLGAKVDVRLGEGLVSGRFAGLDHEGALLLDTEAGPRKIVSGELLGRAA